LGRLWGSSLLSLPRCEEALDRLLLGDDVVLGFVRILASHPRLREPLEHRAEVGPAASIGSSRARPLFGVTSRPRARTSHVHHATFEVDVLPPKTDCLTAPCACVQEEDESTGRRIESAVSAVATVVGLPVRLDCLAVTYSVKASASA